MLHERETAVSELTSGHLAEMKAVHDSHESLVSKMKADFETNIAAKEQEHAKNMQILQDKLDQKDAEFK